MDGMQLDQTAEQHLSSVDGGHQQVQVAASGSVPMDSYLAWRPETYGKNLELSTDDRNKFHDLMNLDPDFFSGIQDGQTMTEDVVVHENVQHESGQDKNDGADQFPSDTSIFGPFPNNGGGEGQTEKVSVQLTDAEHRLSVDEDMEKNSAQSQDMDGETLAGSPAQCTPASKAIMCDASAAGSNVSLIDGSTSLPGGKRALEIEVDASESSKRLCSQAQHETPENRPGPPSRSDWFAPENHASHNVSTDNENDLRDELERHSEASRKRTGNGHYGSKRGTRLSGKRDAVSKTNKAPENQPLGMEHVLNFDPWNQSDVFHRDQGEHDQDTGLAFETDDLKTVYEALAASVPEPKSASTRAAIRQLRIAVNALTGKTAERCQPTRNGKWAIKGMTCELETYQVIAAGMMRLIENRSDRARQKFPRGGLLADEMGLGKTVELLSCTTNAKTKPSYKGQPTLIITPGSVLKQWQREVETHVDVLYRGKKTFIYKGSTAKISGITEEAIRSYPYVLTTYAEVCNSYPKPTSDVESEEQMNDWEQSKGFKDRKGQLHDIHWERIVLDEAQAIKNEQSWTSRACIALTAKYYWALTGTPSPNGPSELFPYFKLVRFPGIKTFADFHQNLSSHLETAAGLETFKSALSQIMIRRRADQEFLGKQILPLPKLDAQLSWVVFDEFERKVYDIIYKRFIDRMKEIVRSKDEKRAYSCVFALFTRLRQLTTHFLVIHDTLVDLLEPEDIKQLRKVAEVYSSTHSKRQSMQSNAPRLDPGKSLSKYLDFLQSGSQVEKLPVLCGKCQKVPKENHQLECGHKYCHPCFESMVYEVATSGTRRITCLVCGIDHELTDKSGVTPKDPPQMKANKYTHISTFEHLLNEFMDGKSHFIGSAKVREFIKLVGEEIRRNPQVKILVFSQFMKTIKLLTKIAEIQGWKSASYHGGMTLTQRDAILTSFKQAKNQNLLFMSLKAGGQGLNITEATCGITIEPWFNVDVELQACCRMYRRGQENETRMYRLNASSSADKVIIDMQEFKIEQNKAVYAGVGKMTAEQLIQRLEAEHRDGLELGE